MMLRLPKDRGSADKKVVFRGAAKLLPRVPCGRFVRRFFASDMCPSAIENQVSMRHTGPKAANFLPPEPRAINRDRNCARHRTKLILKRRLKWYPVQGESFLRPRPDAGRAPQAQSKAYPPGRRVPQERRLDISSLLLNRCCNRSTRQMLLLRRASVL